MIRIMEQDFAKQVKRELRKKSNGFNKVVVRYNINNATKNGTLTIEVWDSFNILKSFETSITFDWWIISMGMHDGKKVEKIVFSTYPTDMILDIILHDHYVECYQNAYGWEFQICPETDKEQNSTRYHISMITFYNAKRTKTIRKQENCFYGYKIIYTEKGDH